MEANRASRKVLMFPWLAYGHISPFLELAKKLSLNGFHVYLCSSPINLQSIRPRLPENFSGSVELVELNLPSLPELPPHMHTTNGLPLHLISTLDEALEMAAPEFSTIIHELSPNLLIIDLFQPWAVQLASSLNIPVVTFLVVSAAAFCHPVPNAEFPFPELDLKDHWISKENPKDSSITVGFNRFVQWLQNLELCSNVILVNSSAEMEAKYIDHLSVRFKKKVLPVGPLVPEAAVSAADERSDVLEWLDGKRPKSTVYVSFGSEYYLTEEDMEELAHGLELSGANFIWAVRFPKGEKVRIEEALPRGFVERVGERGMVVDGWAPQLRILKHGSVGGFVCHCGWNSMVEAVVHGVPIIALPMRLDQPCHARVAVAAGVGVEAARGAEGGVEREGVAEAIKQVLFGKTGEDLNRKAREICGTLKAKEGKNIQECVVEIGQLCLSKSTKPVCLNGN